MCLFEIHTTVAAFDILCKNKGIQLIWSLICLIYDLLVELGLFSTLWFFNHIAQPWLC